MKKGYKKSICVLLALLFTVSLLVIPVMAEDNITVLLNGTALSFDVPPQIINDRTMVPMRAIFEAMGAVVDWNGDTKTVTAERGGDVIIMQIDNAVITVNGREITLDVPPQIVDDRTLIPVRAVAEGLSATVGWDGDTKTVTITTVDTDKYVKGILTDTGFESAYLNLRFTLPDGYVMGPNDSSYEMLASTPSGSPNVSVIAEKLTSSAVTEEQYIETVKSQSKNLNGEISYTFDNETTAVELAGENYIKLSAEAYYGDAELMKDILMRKIDNRMVLITFSYTADTSDEMEALMACFTEF